ncbi:Hypothetical predicted protein [Mytilus galloprovincialis]|uniref:Uncharacterized protein n=1 Tax=Mytilus galloprovincialis TaxID=29158 RepID=A0A8B6DVD4_MYTGA|nr:Hypothetical predicted protein [Mytilus galloprovincialis]
MLGSVSMETKQQSEKRKEAAIFLAINVITDLNESVTTEAFSSSTATDHPASTTESTTGEVTCAVNCGAEFEGVEHVTVGRVDESRFSVNWEPRSGNDSSESEVIEKSRLVMC